MKNKATHLVLLSITLAALMILPPASPALAAKGKNQTPKDGKTMVLMETSMGNVKLELYPEKAPVTVENFLAYVKDGFFDGTVFHRVIKGFVIQGGGFTAPMQRKETKPPIKNEADNGLKNDKGYICMARTSDVNSATSQFFINLADNDFLNHGVRDYGYAVFGKVVEGLDVVDKIGSVQTGPGDVPKEPVVIKSLTVVKE